jgi:hypothetical protein
VRRFPKKRKVHIDVPQLPNSLPAGRQAPERIKSDFAAIPALRRTPNPMNMKRPPKIA